MLGSGCANCRKLKAVAEGVVRDLELTEAAGRIVLVLGLALLSVLALAACGATSGNGTAATANAPLAAHSTGATPKVTFVELGSDSCIPCKEMRPVMDAIAREFGDQVNVVFYDVWKDDAPAKQYGIRYIPTQVFLDDKGVEFHRHTGFYPQGAIEALLEQRGLAKLTTR